MKSKRQFLSKFNLKKLKKIAIFDLVSSLILLSIIIFLFFFLFRKKTYINITLRVRSNDAPFLYFYDYDNPPSWFSFLLREGMEERDSLGRTEAEVTKVLLYDITPETKAAYLTIRLRADYNKRENKYKYHGEPALIGSYLELQFEELRIKGLVTHIEGVTDPREKTELELEARLIDRSSEFPETRGIEPHIAEAFSIGDKSYDSQGSVMAEILDKKVVPADKLITDDKGNIFVRKDPFKKDVFLKLKIKVTKINNELFFLDTEKVEIDRTIPVQLEKITIWPVITKIY